jgi:hypothetical protein
MVLGVETVFPAFEEIAELDRLVGLVGVHGSDVQAGDPEREGAEEGAEEETPKGLFRHLAGRP